ncbi:glycerol-3-phosphate dehydrogenase [Kineosphaera limosa]|uniref:Glycerol-3-phosphate dehydrogenase n=1 Tax=Kineosphaera limosa NBRC 100340 TaxID=1184609 RepID=K6WFA0_9MICO|nr:glycerol-3-phosphate dehydrogenase/oxidase [Kineosphaera limosa]NYD99069.1 glycerol-3-phosphate dehydrogenase [Kineosphaera limosa]GAB97970.1 glycerol-3-phosphate dehydrogenase [Kineosphaera limosa NBRC 100340]
MASTELTPAKRTEALAQMSSGEPLDILVVGGGVTGAGIVLDAVTRGLRVGIVEAQDWGSGTSSRSSKLVHGGLRYLQQLDFKLVFEALHEREHLLDTLAPHLVRPVSFLYPINKKYVERPYVAAGVGLYDVLARVGSRGSAMMPFHKHYSAQGVREEFPDAKPDAMVGAIKYWDATVDDARLVLALVRTAVQFGAYAASRTKVERFTKTAGRVDGAVVTDLETGTEHTIKARTVIAAAGVWTEETQDRAQAEGGLKVLASKGVHIVVPRERIAGDTGVILQTEKSVLFIIPWSRYWIIGTTDTPYHQDFTHPAVTGADLDYILEHANGILEKPLTRDDIVGSFAGLRPLLQPGTKGEGEPSSTKISREHTVAEATPGLVTIAGGKLTTYRVMAEDAVDFALGRTRAKEVPSLTAKTPLLGAVGYETYQRRADKIAAQHGLSRFMVDHLLHRYGALLPELLEMVAQHPDLGRPLEEAPAYLRAEIAYACTHEGALHLEDIMVTRTRLTYEVREHGRAAVPEIAAIAAEYLGWDDARREAEIAAYRARCEAEDAAAQLVDEDAAARARAEADEVTEAVSA